MLGERLRQQVEDHSDATAGAKLAVGDQPDGHGDRVELGQPGMGVLIPSPPVLDIAGS